MWFIPIIELWNGNLAGDLGLPGKNVKRWVDFDSIPAEWFAPVARAAAARGFTQVTVELLAARAEARAVERRHKTQHQTQPAA